jgi:uncharacterized protein YjiS (DUF1127 family)
MNTLTDCQEAEHESITLPFGGVLRWFARGAEAIARAYAGRRILNQLARSDDRMLKDIGLDRSDLRNAASEPIYRDPTELLAGHVGEIRPRRGVRNRTLNVVLGKGPVRPVPQS